MNWELRVDKIVAKELSKVSKKDAERVFKVIKSLAFNPYYGDIEKIKDEDSAWRRRVGSYRIFYEVNKNQKFIHVTDVKRRTSKTY